jgi:solute carrier family 30 (zinc transporter), member 1
VIVRSASFILLQAVPSTISLEGIREDIQGVGGVLSVHELHVWQLSEDKIVASVHVWVARDREYMHIAHAIRKILHDHGVHSSTIQPEFHMAENTPPEDTAIVCTVFDSFSFIYQRYYAGEPLLDTLPA